MQWHDMCVRYTIRMNANGKINNQNKWKMYTRFMFGSIFIGFAFVCESI